VASKAGRALIAALVLGSLALAQEQSAGPVVDALRALFIPQTPLTVRFERVRADLAGRFPFSVVAQLQGWQVPVQEVELGLSGNIGPFRVELGYFQPVASAIRTGMGLVIFVATLWWVINRITPVLKI
jgi:hypothetical protein